MTIDHTVQALLLEIVDKGAAKLSARAIDIRFSDRHAATGVSVLDMLKELAREQLVERHVEPGNPVDRWEITAAGRTWLHRNAAT
jgi:DNA-binding PadR family transcriptional regulator